MALAKFRSLSVQRPDVKIYRVERREGPREVASIKKIAPSHHRKKIATSKATRFIFAMATATSKSNESFGVSDDGFPSLSRVSTVPQRGTFAAHRTALYQRSGRPRVTRHIWEFRALSITAPPK